MSGGWVKLYRQLLDKPIWQCSIPEQKAILITLLLMANHREKKWEWQGDFFTVKPGQFITSLQSIKEKAGKGISIQNIRTALSRFEKYGFLTNKSTKTGRLITIVNWKSYQDDVKPSNNEGNKELTNNQQSINKELTPNKNDKNVRMKEDLYILTHAEEKFLSVLNQVENYPVNREKDLKMYHALAKRYPKLNLLEAIEQWRIYKLDKPLKENSNPRSQINMAFKKYTEWGKCLKGGKKNGKQYSADRKYINENTSRWGERLGNSKLFKRKLG